jgi:hypothetical protein
VRGEEKEVEFDAPQRTWRKLNGFSSPPPPPPPPMAWLVFLPAAKNAPLCGKSGEILAGAGEAH